MLSSLFGEKNRWNVRSQLITFPPFPSPPPRPIFTTNAITRNLIYNKSFGGAILGAQFPLSLGVPWSQILCAKVTSIILQFSSLLLASKYAGYVLSVHVSSTVSSYISFLFHSFISINVFKIESYHFVLSFHMNDTKINFGFTYDSSSPILILFWKQKDVNGLWTLKWWNI